MSKSAEHSVVISMPQARLPSAAASEAAALIGMIERAASDPSMDIERVERMYAMYERAAARNAKSAYDAAMADMQPMLPAIGKKGEGHNKVKYALWEDIAEGILGVIGQHGFSLTFRVNSADGKITVTAVLAHRDGHREETSLVLPSDTTGNKNAVQAIGSSTSYGKRYTACSLLNIITRGEDDDAKSALAPETLSEDQQMTLREMIEATEADLKGFCKYFKVERLSDMKASDYDRAVASLKRKAASK